MQNPDILFFLDNPSNAVFLYITATQFLSIDITKILMSIYVSEAMELGQTSPGMKRDLM